MRPLLLSLLAILHLAGCATGKDVHCATLYERNVERSANESFQRRLANP